MLDGIITAEISPGELIDKITILTIKSERMEDIEKVQDVEIERCGVPSRIVVSPIENIDILAQIYANQKRTVWAQ